MRIDIPGLPKPMDELMTEPARQALLAIPQTERGGPTPTVRRDFMKIVIRKLDPLALTRRAFRSALDLQWLGARERGYGPTRSGAASVLFLL